MRFLKLLVWYTLQLTIVTLVGGYLVIYLSLTLAVNHLKADLLAVKNLSLDPVHTRDCQVKTAAVTSFTPSSKPSHPVKGYQLRFVNDIDYVVEAICQAGPSDPLTVKKDRLPWLTRKAPGYAGMFFPVIEADDQPSTPSTAKIVVTLWLAARSVEYSHGRLILSNFSLAFQKPAEAIDPGSGQAQATCEGWGYQCCDAKFQAGRGKRLSQGVTDCKSDCYRTCLNRPILLYLNTQPGLNPKTRQLEVSGQASDVEFGYSVVDYDRPLQSVTLDFGDGQNLVSTMSASIVSHRFQCGQKECAYIVKLTAEDTTGLKLAETRFSQVFLTQFVSPSP